MSGCHVDFHLILKENLKVSCVLKDSCFRNQNGVVFLQKKLHENKYMAELIPYNATQNAHLNF